MRLSPRVWTGSRGGESATLALPIRRRRVDSAPGAGSRVRPFALFGLFLVLIGAVSLLFSFLALSSTGGACLGGHSCPAGYASWYEGRVLIWGIFGAFFLLLGLWLLARRRRPWGGYGGYGGGGWGGPYGAGGGGWGYAGGVGGPRFCPRCGARNGPNFQFCHRCGAPLGGPSGPMGPRIPPP